MPAYLASHARAATVGDDVVLLDTARGAYFCLPQAAGAFDLTPGQAHVLDDHAGEDLDQLGLVARQPAPALRPPPTPSRQVDPGIAGALTGPETRDALASYGDMVGGYYGRGFGAILARAQAVGPSPAVKSPTPNSLTPNSLTPRPPSPQPTLTGAADLIRRVQVFRAWLPWAPFPGVCLYRSRMLLSFLRRAGLTATWVFGVRTWPFEAHCWLQVDDLVLDDTLDNVLNFSPIHWVGP